jgi:hypothetical protein
MTGSGRLRRGNSIVIRAVGILLGAECCIFFGLARCMFLRYSFRLADLMQRSHAAQLPTLVLERL